MVEVGGERFRFYFDRRQPGILHITLQHGTTPEDAVGVFFSGASTVWDEGHLRFETLAETHGIHWVRHRHDDSVIMISCFRRGGG